VTDDLSQQDSLLLMHASNVSHTTF